jgi:hypothetical protein
MKHMPNFIKILPAVLDLKHADAHYNSLCSIFLHAVKNDAYMSKCDTKDILDNNLGAWDGSTTGTCSIETGGIFTKSRDCTP